MQQNAFKRIMVAGGSGFLGSHLCERLLKDGYNVVCVDNFYTGARENISHLLDNLKFELVAHDITIPFYLEADAIFNLASPAHPIHFNKAPVETAKACALGAINLLDLATRLKAPILQASTSGVYGAPLVHPQPETYWGNVNPLDARACYDEGKRFAETLFFAYHSQHAVHTKTARIFNTYGPRMRPLEGRVVSKFILQALRHESITVHGDGGQAASQCFVDDVIDGLVRLMLSSQKTTEPINFGDPSEFSVLELAEMIRYLTNSRSEIVFENLRRGTPIKHTPDISLAEKTLGWQPKTSLKEGLAQTIAHIESLGS